MHLIATQLFAATIIVDIAGAKVTRPRAHGSQSPAIRDLPPEAKNVESPARKAQTSKRGEMASLSHAMRSAQASGASFYIDCDQGVHVVKLCNERSSASHNRIFKGI